MQNKIKISINRVGEFAVTPEQADGYQCGMTEAREYGYEVTIEATETCLKAPDMFLIDNGIVKDYFEKKYIEEGAKCESCETMACEAIRYFRGLFIGENAPHPHVDVSRILVIIRGSKNSFIKALWENDNGK